MILDCFGFALPLLCDWSRKIAPLAQPIKCKTKTNSNSVTRVFPRFKLVGCFYHEVSLANDDVSLWSNRYLWLLRIWFSITQSKIASSLLLLLFLFLLHRKRGLIFLVLLCLIMLIAFKMQRFSMNDVDNGIVSVFRCCCYCLHLDQEIKILGYYTVSDERLVIESSKFVWKGKLRVRSKCSWFVNCWNSILDQQILSHDPSSPACASRRKP